MEGWERRGTSTVAKVVITLLAGLVVLVLLFPGSGVDTQPPECYSVFGYTVPCEAWVSWAAGALTAGVGMAGALVVGPPQVT